MDKVRKRLLAGLLALVMVVSFLPVQAYASEPADGTYTGAEDQTAQGAPELPWEESAEGTAEGLPEETLEIVPEAVPEETLPYYLLITHALVVDGEPCG